MDVAEFCSICTVSFDSGERRIRCSGQSCHLVFHTRCACLTEDLVQTWLDDDFGLFWFCSTCRTDLVPAGNSSRESGKHKMEEGEEALAAKRIRMDVSPRLPPEIWNMIFQLLDSRWLARVRLVCRDWNELVSTRSDLMERFLLRLRRTQVVDNLEELRHFLALGRGYTRAHFDFFEMGKDKPRIVWFEALGETVTTLTCSCVPFGYLYQLLRVFPNLKRLTLDNCFEYGKAAKLNYQLTKLEELSIECFFNKKHGYGESIFPTLQHICPRITMLKLSMGEYNNFYRDIGRFVFAVRDTLQDLHISDAFYASPVIMDALVKIDGLKLKRIDINCPEQELVRLLHQQQTVERLHYHGQVTKVSTLDEIATILPNLKQLKMDHIKIVQTSSTKLVNFARTKYIRVYYYGPSDGVSGLAYCQSTSLQQLEISGAYLSCDALTSLTRTATQLKSVSFTNCTVERLSDILSFIQQAKSLDTFNLSWLRIKTVCEMADTAYGHSGVRHLKFFDNSKDLLHALCELCPEIETLHVKHDLAEDDMTKMGQQLQRLKSLSLNGCRSHGQAMQVECLRPIASSFVELKKLEVNAWCVSKEKVLEALQGIRNDVEVSYSYW